MISGSGDHSPANRMAFSWDEDLFAVQTPGVSPPFPETQVCKRCVAVVEVKNLTLQQQLSRNNFVLYEEMGQFV